MWEQIDFVMSQKRSHLNKSLSLSQIADHLLSIFKPGEKKFRGWWFYFMVSLLEMCRNIYSGAMAEWVGISTGLMNGRAWIECIRILFAGGSVMIWFYGTFYMKAAVDIII